MYTLTVLGELNSYPMNFETQIQLSFRIYNTIKSRQTLSMPGTKESILNISTITFAMSMFIYVTCSHVLEILVALFLQFFKE